MALFRPFLVPEIGMALRRGVTKMQRTTSRTRHLLAGALALVAFGVVPAAAHAGTLQVVPVGLGSVTVSPPATAAVPSDPEVNSGLCSETGTGGTRTDLGGACTMTYPAGTTVTLTAATRDDGEQPPTGFLRWSDDRCPGTGPCTVTVGADDQTVAALFSPQRVSVVIAGSGTVTSAPAGLSGTCDTESAGSCFGDFDPSRPVTFAADGTNPMWLPNNDRRGVLCDESPGVTCQVLPAWPRWVSVGFGVNAAESFPPEITVNFHVGKTGAGSGTIRSGSLNCGGQCTTKAKFGASETFTATPDNGSRFAGWRAACGNAATCRLAVGPVTSLTAVFDKAAGAVAGTKNPGTTKPKPRQRAFAARVLRIGVSGHGSRRTLSIRLQVNSAATVRARLLRGRKQIATHRWRVRWAGVQVLRMRVPARARPGSYRVRLTITGRGRTVRVTRGVRVRR
jgi:hypothetical protein